MRHARTAAMIVVLLALAAGCSTTANPDTAPPDGGDNGAASGTTCAAIADDAVAMINDYLETAGPTVQDAPPPPEALDEPLERRFTAVGCSHQQFRALMAERLDQIQGTGEPADMIREAIIFGAASESEG